jgi:IclR family pca regulon transcriptional regulator
MKPYVLNEKYFVEALARGLEVLSLFSRERPTLTMSEVVKLTGLNKTAAYRILSTLEMIGYLHRDPATRRYRPDLKVLTLGFNALDGLDIRQIARPHLEQLARELDLTASLTILDQLYVVYVDRIRNREIVGVLLGLGSRVPAHCSSMGKVMLAYLAPHELDTRLRGVDLQACSPRSITSVTALRTELERVRQQGYAINDGELTSGLRAVAAPIFNVNDRIVAAINVSGSRDTISDERLHDELPPKVMRTAHLISSNLAVIAE